MSTTKVYKEYDQCPICGDPLLKNKKDSTRLLCDCCGYSVSIETVIKHDDEERLRQAQDALRSYEFDRAEDRYNLILEDNSPNSEVYLTALFGKLLSLFGVVYIKDFNGDAIPTFSEYDPDIDSIKDSDVYREIVSSPVDINTKRNYLNLVDKLDNVYQRINREINEKSIYDFFICTKISRKTSLNPNADGLTSDSSYASRFYDFLTKSGYNVFYSDKCCNEIEYDSQILSALLKSKKMLVISTQGEYLESPWVQSEWRRWINFINCGKRGKDSLILCFPTYELKKFDLPRTLRKVQRYTSEIDAINAINSQIKVVTKETPKPKVESVKIEATPKETPVAEEVKKPVEKVVKNRQHTQTPEELYMLAEKYYEGNGVEKNLELALKYYTLSADKGDMDAQFSLGLMYGVGEGCKVDLQKSYYYHKLSADQGHLYAQYEVGQCYRNGWGCSVDIDEAIRYFTLSSKAGYEEAKKALDILNKEKLQKQEANKPKVEEKVTSPKEKPQVKVEVKNEPTNEEKIADYLNEAKNFEKVKDFAQAVNAYKKASELGSSEAYLKLGEAYEIGQGCRKKEELALEYYGEAINLGNPEGYVKLSKIQASHNDYFLAKESLVNFKKHPKIANDKNEQKRFINLYDLLTADLFKAIDNGTINGSKDDFYKFAKDGNCRSSKQIIYCFEKAASLGHELSLLELAEIYHDNKLCAPDQKKTLDYYEKYARCGHIEVSKMLADWYSKGNEFAPKNQEKEYEMLLLCAQLGDLASLRKAHSLIHKIEKGENLFRKTFECNLIGTKLGDDEFIYGLAGNYELGLGCSQNLEEALDLYTKLAYSPKINKITDKAELTKYYYSQYKLSEFYLKGLHVEKDSKKAFELLNEFYNKYNKNYFVVFGIAECYYRGFGVKKDEDMAIEYYKLSASLNYKEAITKLCSFYLKGKDIKLDEKTKFKYLETINAKPVEVLKELASAYMLGVSLNKNLTKAYEYYKEAADKGDIESVKVMIEKYLSEKDDYNSSKYQEVLAKRGDIGSIKSLATYYEKIGTPKKDFGKAIEYYLILADMGDSEAQYKVGNMLLTDQNLHRDFIKAVKYLEMAAKQNHTLALFTLGECYIEGVGCAKDDKKAFEYYLLAANQNHPKSQYEVAKRYLYGRGTQIDYQKSVYWYEKLFEDGKEKMLFSDIVLSGVYLEVASAYKKADPKANKQKYVEYYKESARRGSKVAKQELHKMLIFKF